MHNQLTDQDVRDGWRLLFDGQTTQGWRNYRQPGLSPQWKAVDGTLHFEPKGGGDIIYGQAVFGDFDLTMEWKVESAGNSGIFYRATEIEPQIWRTGFEYQILDNIGHRDGGHELTCAGSLYALYPAAKDLPRPVGEWNLARIVARGASIEHWLNGVRVAEIDLASEDYRARVAGSKFGEMPLYGQFSAGYIGLQDHGDPVWYRNLKIRPLV